MFLNDRSLTNQKDGLSNLLNLTNQNLYVRLVDEKNEENNGSLAGRPSSKGARSFRAHFDPFPPFLRPATQANLSLKPLLKNGTSSATDGKHESTTTLGKNAMLAHNFIYFIIPNVIVDSHPVGLSTHSLSKFKYVVYIGKVFRVNFSIH